MVSPSKFWGVPPGDWDTPLPLPLTNIFFNNLQVQVWIEACRYDVCQIAYAMDHVSKGNPPSHSPIHYFEVSEDQNSYWRTEERIQRINSDLTSYQESVH